MTSAIRYGSAILPVLLLVALVWIFLAYGPLGILKTAFPPIESVSFERIVLEQDSITIEIINDGPDSVTISQVLINDAYNRFDIDIQTINHLERAKIVMQYPWAEGLPLKITLLTADGLTFDKEIPVATESPKFGLTQLLTFTTLGIYVGVMPVFLGLLWLPFLKTLSKRWYDFFLALTIGLLVFLTADAIEGAFSLSSQVAASFQGSMLVPIGFFLALLILMAFGERDNDVDVTKTGVTKHTLRLSYMIALGIGVHNLGEGLAIGSAYAIGEIALGSLLVIGFMIHNLTEGIAIVAPIAKEKKNSIKHLLLLGLLAGGPTIIGTWIGGFVFSNLWAVLFLSVGAGAIVYVILEVFKYMKKENPKSGYTFTNVAGFFLGVLIMYITGLLVA
ncbi:MAG: ZIP family metal transporter [Candidatus Micrarchaeota archaeon]|nr:ZIP family metal transporter [Candidatus Micrarchaeota archaeon]